MLKAQADNCAVQITTLLGDSVVGVHRLDGEACGRVRYGTRALLALAAALLVGGVVSALQQSYGAAASLLLLCSAFGVLAMTRAARERSAPHFLVGEGREVQLPLPASLLPASCFPLVLSTPEGYHLLFGQGMEGIVEDGGTSVSLSELTTSGRAWPAAGLPARAVPLPQRGRAWVRIGESTVVVELVEAGAKLRAPLLGALDSSGLASNVCSFGAHAVVLALVFAIPPSGNALSIDSFNVDSRAVRYLVKPQEHADSQLPPPWLRRRSSDEQRAGGPANREAPGKLGNPKARPLRGRLAVKGTSTELRPAKEWAHQLARDYGILGILSSRRGGPFAHRLADDSALGRDAVDAMGTLIANHVGEDDGTGGLTATGARFGGGGHDIGLIPGTGVHIPNGRGPGGWGPWKAPPKQMRDHNADAPKLKMIVHGDPSSYPKELIRREIKRHLNEVRYCYSKELQGKPELQGRVMINFTIAATGRVVVARVQQTTLGDAEVESCIAQAFYRWSFPKPPEGIVVVSYPFYFHPTER